MAKRTNRYEQKWGELTARKGFTQVPTVLFALNEFAADDESLRPPELLILLQLVSFWWEPDDRPFPSIATLAKRCGCSKATVERSMKNLLKRGLISRIQRRENGVVVSNAYELDGLKSYMQEIVCYTERHFKMNVAA